jgi:acyl carrier protein
MERTYDDVEAVLVKALHDIKGRQPEALHPDLTLGPDLDVDSADMAELITLLEDELGMEVSEGQFLDAGLDRPASSWTVGELIERLIGGRDGVG